MGYYIFSFGIKESEILNTFNSRDEQIIIKVENDKNFKNYNDQDDKFTTKNALLDIVNGKKMNEKYGYAYGYTIISLCSTLGHKLYEQEIKLGVETDYINQFLKEDFGIEDFDIEEYLFNDENLKSFPIPTIVDWPMLSVIKLEELKILKTKLSNVIISEDKIDELQDCEDDEEKVYAYEHIKGIIDNIDFCIKNKLDLFSTCH